LAVLLVFGFSQSSMAMNGKHFDRIITVIFENADYSEVIRQPLFKYLADQSAHFSNFVAVTHPSQGNYIALTSGSLHGLWCGIDATADSRCWLGPYDETVDLDVKNIVDLLEARGVTWRVYAEKFPGNCFKGETHGKYTRNHNPFISYVNIQRDPSRCSRIVNADLFDQDAANGTLPEYIFYIPDGNQDGHDTGVEFADRWYEKFVKYIQDPKFMENTVLVSTFDEDHRGQINQIYTTIFGPAVKSGVYPENLNTYSLLALVEQNWDLGDLGKEDANAPRIPNIWK
jgi:hypothetical protein